jgi:hypothetical protein
MAVESDAGPFAAGPLASDEPVSPVEAAPFGGKTFDEDGSTVALGDGGFPPFDPGSGGVSLDSRSVVISSEREAREVGSVDAPVGVSAERSKPDVPAGIDKAFRDQRRELIQEIVVLTSFEPANTARAVYAKE